MTRSLAALTMLGIAACSMEATVPADEATGEATVAASSPSVPSRAPATAEEDIRHVLLQEYPDAGPMQYALAWSDLDGDGRKEAIVHLVGSYFCGTGGCNTLVLTPAGPMRRKVGDISVSRTPITVLDTKTNGWKDLTVAIGGGGGAAGTALLKFNGESYPSNPTVPPAEVAKSAGVEIILADPKLVPLVPETPAGQPSGG